MTLSRLLFIGLRLLALLLLAIPILIGGPGGQSTLHYAREILPTIPVFTLLAWFTARKSGLSTASSSLIDASFLYSALATATTLVLAFAVDTNIPALRQILRCYHYCGAVLLLWMFSRKWPPAGIYLTALGLLCGFPFLWSAIWNTLGSLPIAGLLLYAYTRLAAHRPLSAPKPGSGQWIPLALGSLGAIATLQLLLAVEIAKAGHQLFRLYIVLGSILLIHTNRLALSKIRQVVMLLMLFNIAFLGLGAFYTAWPQGTLDIGELLQPGAYDSLAGVNANDAGAFLVLALLVFLYWRPVPDSFRRLVWFLPGGLILILLLLTRARIAVLSLLVAFFGPFLSLALYQALHARKPAGTLKAIGIASLVLLPVLAAFMALHHWTLHPHHSIDTLFERFALWTQALQYLVHHPWGSGPAQHPALLLDGPAIAGSVGHIRLQQTYLNNMANLHAHNLVLQLWLDYGPLAGIGFICLLALMLAGPGWHRPKRWTLVGPLFVAVSFQGLFNYHLIDFSYSFFCGSLMGFGLRLSGPARSASTNALRTSYWHRAIVAVILTVGLYFVAAATTRQLALQELREYLYVNRVAFFEMPFICANDTQTEQCQRLLHDRDPVDRFSKAMRHLDRALLLNPANPELNLLQGDVHLWLYRATRISGHKTKAEHFYQLAAASEYCPGPGYRRLLQFSRLFGSPEKAKKYEQKLRLWDSYELLQNERHAGI
ncbi:MAG: O-antigen ligase family protein [Leptospiraceae bacterium]|nr:O-antigen ligase family protein [Leptospiraceae bacterium]